MSSVHRSGSLRTTAIIAASSLLALAALVFLAARLSDRPPVNRPGRPTEPLLLYCAASNKPVVERVTEEFGAEVGGEVQVQYGPSQTLLSNIEVSRTGDLFLPADDFYIGLAEEKKLTSRVFPLAKMHGTLVVAKGNPKQIASFADLLLPEIRVSLAGEAAAVGKIGKEVLQRQGKWDRLAANVQSFKTTVNDVANDVKVGAADAGIVWDSVAVQYAELETIALPELKEMEGKVGIAVLTTSRQPQAALEFARYLAAADKGLAVYRELGFHPVPGESWQPRSD